MHSSDCSARCSPQSFKTEGGKSNNGQMAIITTAEQLLYAFVEEYFSAGFMNREEVKVRKTLLPPLYFQHPGHSLTIIGFEKFKDGTRGLLVFDPMFNNSPGMMNLIGHHLAHSRRPWDLLHAYRRQGKYLRRYQEFEVLR